MAFVCLNCPSTLLLSLVLTKPTNSRNAADTRLACIRRPFSTAGGLGSSSPAGRSWPQTRKPRESLVTARSMAPVSVDKEEGFRPEMLATERYTPPSWASELRPAPSHFVSLGQYPTPIHRWNLPGLPKDTKVWIKRDDLTGMQLSGNKVRKLEFLMADAKAQGKDCVITIGGIQSNHCRATAVAARYLGLDCYLILRTSRTVVEVDPGLVGNLLVERMVGAHVSLVTKEEYVQHGSEALMECLVAKLKSEGRKPYVIPVGGSNSLGTWAYVEFVRELQSQLEGGRISGVEHFDDIVMACGSGATTAGIALAVHLSNLETKVETKVHAYAISDSPEYFYKRVQDLINGLNADVNSDDIVRVIDAKGSGYAESTTKELKLAKKVAELTGIIVDPVYSGKALNGMLKEMAENPSKWKGRKVLFVHTGGLLGMYDKVQQLQPLIGKWERFKVADCAPSAITNLVVMNFIF